MNVSEFLTMRSLCQKNLTLTDNVLEEVGDSGSCISSPLSSSESSE